MEEMDEAGDGEGGHVGMRKVGAMLSMHFNALLL